MTRILLLGGTTEASALAAELARCGVDAVFSYAGRTAAPVAQPLPTRTGGFGGADGLAAYLGAEGISHVIDATHPFAAGMSRNAIAACRDTHTPLLAFERPVWMAGQGDRWSHVADTEAAVAALPDSPARVFLAIGKQTLHAFAAKPQHHYLLRLVDPPEAPLPLPLASVILAKGPFSAEGDEALLRAHAITHVVAKNAGGSGAEAKLHAARALGLPVILIDRPHLPPRARAESVAEVMAWIAGHPARLGV
ncbi:cobalt-precorrin-6A reductase [Paragemmobacter straminiformis]|uniref:Cobalt-precorrin-6A reductase n=1 Tax=Paragemmobacter straminiformis TaxID=2045119 RepID=A0A842I340_9RHOB|nr:cobalt-precorrin-6A reductase [Gemmobacter straminiformis]MBC2834310.1 cobalt-precorrin-6A reductase [Gemmobacter straminiformis]